MDTNLLNNIAFDIVKDKVIEDKMKEYTAQLEENDKKPQKEKEDEDQDEVDFDEVDSEEERIMQKELSKRKVQTDMVIEKEKEKQKMRYGHYREIDESQFLDTLLQNDKVVCHFYHNEFERCKIMDKHLQKIAETHPDTLFVKINADKTPFFTTKLNIKVYNTINVQILPTVILSIDGKAFDRVIGFEDLGGQDDFTTISLIRRLVLAKMIKPNNKSEKGEITISKTKKEVDDDLDY